MRKRLILISILTLFLSLGYISANNNIKYGLHMKTYPYDDWERTSLVLENKKPYKFSSETSLSFDLYIRNEHPFGMVSRLITSQNEVIDFYIVIGENGNRYPTLVINESIYLMSDMIVYEKWVPVKLSFSSSRNEITVLYGSSSLSVPYPVSKISESLISFGICPVNNYTIYDIAPVDIRNIKIYNDDKLTRCWDLKNHEDNITYDLVENIPAITENPAWLIDDYSTWHKFYTCLIPKNSFFTYDDKDEKLYILLRNKKEFLVYDLKSQSLTRNETKNNFFIPDPARMVYDGINNELILFNLETKSIIRFSIDELTFYNNGKREVPQHSGYFSSSVLYSSEDSLLYSFGGYGYLKYNNDFIRMNPYTDSINTLKIESIYPRFHSSATKIDDKLYLFGGRGSKSGRQEIFPRQFYDFFEIDLLTNASRVIWSCDSVETDFYVGEHMVYDEMNDCFYLLSDDNDLTLLKISETEAGFDPMSYFHRDKNKSLASYRSLYYSSDRKNFYAVMLRDLSDQESEIVLYSLNYPPLTINSAGKLTSMENRSARNMILNEWFRPVFITFILIAFASFVFFIIRKKRLSFQNILKFKPQNDLSYGKTKDEGAYSEDNGQFDFSKSSVRLLGSFSVYDKNSENITRQFSPMLRDIFVLLVLSTAKEEKGILGKELIRILWYDKNEESAKNNRNVYFSKLRALFLDIGKIEIENRNGFWRIVFSENIACDYICTLNLISEIKAKASPDLADLQTLLNLLDKGVLLPDIEWEWLDGFKRDYSNRVIDILTNLSQNADLHLECSIRMRIADSLYLHDYLNEEALYLRCSAYLELGKKGIAKNIYETYCKEYHSLLNSNYKYSLFDVINRKNIL